MSDRSPSEESLEELANSDWSYAASEHSMAIWPTGEANKEDESEADESSSAAASTMSEMDTEEEPEEKESPLAKLIMEDLASGPTLTCMAWKKALRTLEEMYPGQRTANTLLTLLQSAVRDENEHWAKLITMRHSLHIESIQKLGFSDELWTCIRHLAGQPAPTWEEPMSYNCASEWLDLQDIVRALHSIKDRIQGTCFGDCFLRDYDLPRGIKRYDSLWKCVVETLEEGKKGDRMQAYVDALLELSSLPSPF
jgi:hypothetical protein